MREIAEWKKNWKKSLRWMNLGEGQKGDRRLLITKRNLVALNKVNLHLRSIKRYEKNQYELNLANPYVIANK